MVIITDKPVVAVIPYPGKIVTVTRVGIDALIEALAEQGRIIQVTPYIARRLEHEHGVNIPYPDARHNSAFILCDRQITIWESSPEAPLEVYLTVQQAGMPGGVSKRPLTIGEISSNWADRVK